MFREDKKEKVTMDKPLRVAQIMGKLWAGGVEMVVFNYYRAIDKEKIQFDFYYDEDSTIAPPQDLIEMGAKFIKLPPYQHTLEYLRVLKRYFKKNNYMIVHSHINTLSVFPLYMAWRCKVPVRIAHNHSVPGGESIKRTGLKYLLRSFSRVFSTEYFACSEKAGRWLFGNKNYENGKVIVIKNAIDFSRFRPSEKELISLKKQLGLEEKFVVGHVGRFTFAKNHEFLIKIFKEIEIMREDAVLILVGDGELNKQIHRWAEQYKVSNRVVFVGQVTNPEIYYRLADVVIIPSIFEGLSLATIESQIAGVPVVVSKAIPEEAIISNACVRLELTDKCWAKTAIEYADKKVILNNRSEAYEIGRASEILENIYLEKVGDLDA